MNWLKGSPRLFHGAAVSRYNYIYVVQNTDLWPRIFLCLTHWGRDKMDATSQVSLKFVPKGPINNIPALVQIMAWRRPGDKPLSEAMMVNLPTHVCVSWPQWVNVTIVIHNNVIEKVMQFESNFTVSFSKGTNWQFFMCQLRWWLGADEAITWTNIDPVHNADTLLCFRIFVSCVNMIQSTWINQCESINMIKSVWFNQKQMSRIEWIINLRFSAQWQKLNFYVLFMILCDQNML